MDNIIKADNLIGGYGKKIVIDDASFSVKKGEIFTLIGPNGSGKSTILKTLTKQVEMLGGAVFLAGNDIANMKESELAKHMSMVMTEKITAELMTCRDIVATGRYPYTGMLGVLSDNDYEIVDNAISLLGADEVANEDFNSISDGQRQRIMLARAICQEPELLILDEPTSFLDIRYKIDILNSIRKLAREKNIAVIMSLHEMDLAYKISDIIAIVNNKKLEMIGSPEEIFKGNKVQNLYGISDNEFDEMTAGIHFEGNKTEAIVFVISSKGKGIPVYNKLFRDGIAFATGIIFDNDIEYYEAKALASKLLASKAFFDVDDELVRMGMEIIDSCEYCICTLEDEDFGPYLKANMQLKEYAISKGKLRDNN